MAASLGKNLILDVGCRNAGIDVELCRPLHIEDVSIAAVHIDDDRRNVEMLRWSAFFRIAHRHRELKLSQRADRAPRSIRNFDTGVHVHVRGSEMSDGKGVPAEINRFEAVIHRQLGAKRVVNTRAEQVGFGFDQLAHPDAGMNMT